MAELVITGTFKIETSEGFVVHPKVIELLREIEISGSLNSAVANIGMSYSYAWNMINKTNCKLDAPLLISRRGGNGGGVAQLTAEGKKLLEYCNKLEDEFSQFIGNHTLKL